MKDFVEVSISPGELTRELEAFGTLLTSRRRLRERKHIKRFFEKSRHLSAYLGAYIPEIGPADSLAYEFDIAGDFVADIVIGNKRSQTYCMVELEEGGVDGVFKVAGRKHTKEWSPRFEHGFSQLVDWFRTIDDLRRTDKLRECFGVGHARFYGLLIIGRSSALSPLDRDRLKWRSERVLIDSHPVHCVTYDDVKVDLSERLRWIQSEIASQEPPL